MRELPSGTVTVLFTDIEGSTRLLHELGHAYAEVLAEHRRVLRETFTRYEGVEVDTQGDAFFYAFARASDAVAAAAEAQVALTEGPVRVRMGLHTGEPTVTDEGYVGPDVHRAARVMGAGHGGQVLLTQATRQLLDPTVPLRDLGEHRLKDLRGPERLYQLGEREFPPPKTLYRTNLPVQSTPLVGRERELEEAGALIRSHRLVTLTGPGGSGKTRLALHLAAEAADRFPDGVFWVPLQAIRDPAIVERAIVAALGADGALAQHIGAKQLLLLLDNFEQIADAAPVVSSVLASTPHARVLVTSREPLHVEAEQRYPVEPLLAAEAAHLFVERASAVAPNFAATPAIGEICDRLDRLPLAIELAAARVAILDVDELLARLDERLPLLASRSRDAPTRQRTLRATIEWSYELLDAREQELFRRLGVFRGSFSLEAAEQICDGDLDGLESLVVKNLLRRWGSGRLGMLDTIREYAATRLDASEEAEAVRRRHAQFFLDLIRDANLDAGKVDVAKPMRHDVALAEQDNVREALTWALNGGDVVLGLQLATAFEWFWVMHDPHEGVRWFRALHDHPGVADATSGVRAHAFRAAGSSADIAGDDAAAADLYERSFALYDEIGDDHGRAVLLHRLGLQALRRGELERAHELVEASHRFYEPKNDLWRLTQTIGTFGAIARDAGDPERAYELVSESAAIARQLGEPWWESGMLAELACLELNRGRHDEAERLARRFLAVAHELGDRGGRVMGVGVLAVVAAERGQLERARRLWRAIEHERVGAPLGGWLRHRRDLETRITPFTGEQPAAAHAVGRQLSLDEAVEEALADA